MAKRKVKEPTISSTSFVVPTNSAPIREFYAKHILPEEAIYTKSDRAFLDESGHYAILNLKALFQDYKEVEETAKIEVARGAKGHAVALVVEMLTLLPARIRWTGLRRWIRQKADYFKKICLLREIEIPVKIKHSHGALLTKHDAEPGRTNLTWISRDRPFRGSREEYDMLNELCESLNSASFDAYGDSMVIRDLFLQIQTSKASP